MKAPPGTVFMCGGSPQSRIFHLLLLTGKDVILKKRSIALIGFRATGKSTVARLLAEKLDWKLLDMDRELSSRFRMDIQSWVKEHGWPSFRAKESGLLEEASRERDIVIATGGGIVEAQANRELLKSKFHTIWLQASPETILARIGNDPQTETNRPPLTQLSPEAEVREMLKGRFPLYAECAHQSVDTEAAALNDLPCRILKSPGIHGI